MIGNGYTPEYAQRVFKQLEGFGSYGFPESHAASFALLVYVSSWLKYYYPDVFACALLNSMPMGFYQPAQIVADAQRHGVCVRAVDINSSFWDNSLEEQAGNYRALRLGFRQVKGLREADVAALVSQRHQPFSHLDDVLRLCLPDSFLEKLADADVFTAIGLNRREAIWHLSVKDKSKNLFAQLPADNRGEEHIVLPALSNGEQVLLDYATTSLSLKAHPVSFVRPQLQMLNVVSSKELPGLKNGDSIKIAGLVLVRQRPQTAKGVWFVTLEDEWGTANLVVFPQVALACKKELLQAKLLLAEGELQIVSNVIHLAIKKCTDISRMLGALQPRVKTDALQTKLSRADEVKNLSSEDRRITDVLKEMPGSRNFR
jgi:error-prone DNA polymerase